jgi:DNA-binding NarL/FixJ family response regulator
LQKFLEPEFNILASVGDGLSLIEAAHALLPEVIVTDISMPRLNGMQAVRRVKLSQPACRVIFLSVHEEPAFAAEARKIGAVGYLLKRYVSAELIPAIHAVLEGSAFVCSALPEDPPFPWLSS